MCTIIATVQAIFSYNCTLMLDMSTYISISVSTADSFAEYTVTLSVESINAQLITLVSALFTGLTLKMTQSLHVHCVGTLHMIA